MSKKNHQTVEQIVRDYLVSRNMPVLEQSFLRKLQGIDKAHEGVRLQNKHYREIVGELTEKLRAKNADIAYLEKGKSALKHQLTNEIGNIRKARKEIRDLREVQLLTPAVCSVIEESQS